MRYLTCLLAFLLVSAAVPAAAQDADDDALFTCGYLCDADGMPISTIGDHPPDTDLVVRVFLGAFSQNCAWAIGGGRQYEPEIHDLTFRYAWDEPDDADRQLRVYRFFCGSGAYNARHIYLTWTASDGVQAASFAVPTFDFTYAGENDDANLVTLTLTGMGARQELVNSTFDPQAGTVEEMSCWRGLCDASSHGSWRLENGQFQLVTYDVDPTYDGEVNLFRVVDFGQPVAVDITTPLPFDPAMFGDDEDEELE